MDHLKEQARGERASPSTAGVLGSWHIGVATGAATGLAGCSQGWGDGGEGLGCCWEGRTDAHKAGMMLMWGWTSVGKAELVLGGLD